MGKIQKIKAAHGAVVVAHIFSSDGDLSDVAVFSSMAKAMDWAELCANDGDVINCCPMLTDNPTFGTMQHMLQ